MTNGTRDLSSGFLQINGRLAAFLDVAEGGPAAYRGEPWRQVWPCEGIVVTWGERGGQRGEHFFPAPVADDDQPNDIGNVALGRLTRYGYELDHRQNITVWRDDADEAVFCVILIEEKAPVYFFRLRKPLFRGRR